MATLYELTEDFLRLMEMAEEDDLDAEAFADTLEGLDGDLEDKAEGYAKVIRTLEGDAEAVKKEIDRLTKKKRVIENRTAAMKEHLKLAMKAMGREEIRTPLFNFKIQKNPASVVIDDVKAIPEEFLIPQDPKPDKEGMKEYLKDNGAPWAHLEQTDTLRIR